MALVRHLMNESEFKSKSQTRDAESKLNAQKAVHSPQKINYENEIVSIN